MEESSLYSAHIPGMRGPPNITPALFLPTFSGTVEDNEVEVVGLGEVVGKDDLFLEVEHGDAGTIEGHPRLFPLGSELVEDRRSHGMKNDGLTRPLL